MLWNVVSDAILFALHHSPMAKPRQVFKPNLIIGQSEDQRRDRLASEIQTDAQ